MQSGRLISVLVVAALIRHGRVLAARRTAPPRLAGQWEFPGGKCEPGETDAAALGRECREELGVEVEVHELLATARISASGELRVYRVSLAAGEPSAKQDHDALRWLAGDELADVAWLPVDQTLLAVVRAAMR